MSPAGVELLSDFSVKTASEPERAAKTHARGESTIDPGLAALAAAIQALNPKQKAALLGLIGNQD
jgi:hypothetical protein